MDPTILAELYRSQMRYAWYLGTVRWQIQIHENSALDRVQQGIQ